MKAYLPPLLPPELLCKVFVECQFADECASIHRSNLPTLMGVCRGWRATALGCGALWASIEVPVHPDMSTALCEATRSKLTVWLQRSRSYPLDVALRYHAPRAHHSPFLDVTAVCTLISELLQRLIWHRSRLRSLALCIPSQALVSLNTLYSVRLPLLSGLDIQTVGVSPSAVLELSSVDMNWERLTTLHLSVYPRVTLEECHRILAKACNLKSCKLTLEASELLPLPSFQRLELPLLRVLQLRLTGSSEAPSFTAFFASLQARVLEDLDIMCLHEHPTDWRLAEEIASFIQRSAPFLTSLRLTNVGTNDQALISLLPSLRRLTILELNFPLQPIFDPVSDAFIAALDWRDLVDVKLPNLPCLVELKLECNGERYVENNLIRMLSSRLKPNDVHQNLRSFNLLTTRRPGPALRHSIHSWLRTDSLDISVNTLTIF